MAITSILNLAIQLLLFQGAAVSQDYFAEFAMIMGVFYLLLAKLPG